MANPLHPSSKSSTRQSSLRRTAGATTATSSSQTSSTAGLDRKKGHSSNTNSTASQAAATSATTTTRGRRRSPDSSTERLEPRVVIPRKRRHQDDDIHEPNSTNHDLNGIVDEGIDLDDNALLLENASNKRAKKSVQYAIRPKANGRAADSHNSSRDARSTSGPRRSQATNTHARVKSDTGPRHARGGRVTKAAQPPPSASVAETTNLMNNEGIAEIGRQENGTQTVAGQQKQPQLKKEKKQKRMDLELSSKTSPAIEQHLINGAVSQKPHNKTLSTASVGERQSLPGAGATGMGAEKRTLRSQDGGSRTKSELSLYFPNYDEFISNEPREEEFLKAETRLFVTEDPISKSPSSTEKSVQVLPQKVTPRKRRASQSFLSTPMRTPATAAATSLSAAAALTSFQKLDFAAPLATLAKQEKSGPHIEDALTPELYAAAHRRSERQEKQLRNIEKERAQHEKVQLERLYDGLRGPDWLRVMGISGVTESERKGWEGKRAYFVKEVGALLEKFRLWREEERRRKVEKELHDREAEESDATEQEATEPQDGEEICEEVEEVVDEEDNGVDEEEEEAESQDGPKFVKSSRHKRSPASSDVDAMAAQQLHVEALLSSTSTKHPPLPSPLAPSTPKNGRRRKEQGIILPTIEPTQPEKAMTSFFAKTHQRDAAMKNSKRSARTQFAFGQPMPEIGEAVFDLPEEYLTADAKRASARSRRRARRKGRET